MFQHILTDSLFKLIRLLSRLFGKNGRITAVVSVVSVFLTTNVPPPRYAASRRFSTDKFSSDIVLFLKELDRQLEVNIRLCCMKLDICCNKVSRKHGERIVDSALLKFSVKSSEKASYHAS